MLHFIYVSNRYYHHLEGDVYRPQDGCFQAANTDVLLVGIGGNATLICDGKMFKEARVCAIILVRIRRSRICSIVYPCSCGLCYCHHLFFINIVATAESLLRKEPQIFYPPSNFKLRVRFWSLEGLCPCIRVCARSHKTILSCYDHPYRNNLKFPYHEPEGAAETAGPGMSTAIFHRPCHLLSALPTTT